MSDAIYEATGEECQLATEWHGGQGSMLYAVSSTGALSRGTLRPYGDDGPMSDAEWSEYLKWKLARELAEVVELADAAGEIRDRDLAEEWLAKMGEEE